MLLNNHRMPLVQRPLKRANTSAPLSLSDSSVNAFYSGLQEEWVLAEGRRVEGPAKEVLGQFTPIGWAKPRNLTSVLDDLVAFGRSSRELEYGAAPIESTAEAIRHFYPSAERMEHPAREALLVRLESALAGCRAFGDLRRFGGNESVTQWSLDHYGCPSKATLDTAWSILADRRTDDRVDDPNLDTAQVVVLVQEQLSALPGEWHVVIEPIQAEMMVRRTARQIVVREGLETSMREVRRLLVHEIGGHIVRTLNSERTEGTLAALSLGTDSAKTEEGLALWWEHTLGVQQTNVLQRYAARAIAVDMALQSGASEIMASLSPHIGERQAAVIALRTKRGMKDPQAPGAFTKDHAYLSGYLDVSEFLENAAPQKLETLMATKWGLSMTPVAEDLIATGVLQPGRMPEEVCHGLARG